MKEWWTVLEEHFFLTGQALPDEVSRASLDGIYCACAEHPDNMF